MNSNPRPGSDVNETVGFDMFDSKSVCETPVSNSGFINNGPNSGEVLSITN